MQAKLLIRQDIFDYAIYPAPTKLSLMNLIQLFSNLNLMSNIENKVTLDQFKDQACQYIPNLQKLDAEIYFLNYKLMIEDDLTFLVSATKKNIQIVQQPQQEKQQITADVRGLAVYLFLQLYTISGRINFSFDQNKDKFGSQFNEAIKSQSQQQLLHNFSPMNSPRSKAIRITQCSNEQQQMVQYIKNNVKTILKLVSNDINNDQGILSQNEFNLLKILFKSDNPKKVPISTLTNLYQTGVNRVNINTLSDWVSKSAQTQEAPDVVLIQGLTKSLMTKDDKSCRGKEIKIGGCEESFIYIDSAVQSVQIVSCVNSTIFVAAVSKICSIEKCENVNITVVSNFLRVGNTVDSIIYYYGSYYPVLYGDNRSITLAPNNANYSEFYERIKAAKIQIQYKSSQIFSQPAIMNLNQNINYLILPLKDYSSLQLPSEFKIIHHSLIQTFDQILQPNFEKQIQDLQGIESGNIVLPLLAPNEYRDAVYQRYKKHIDLQQKIKNAGLNNDEQLLLHQAIQGHFREFLVQSGQFKPITDLVKHIDQE